MNKFMKKKAFLGIDISKDELDFSLLTTTHPTLFKDKKVANSFTGFSHIEMWLSSLGLDLEDCLFCMEHTGTYGLLLFAWLSQMGADYVVEPALRIKKSIGMTRGKSDRIDARRIADYAYTNKAKLELYSMPSATLLKLKQLLTYRDQITRMVTGFKNSIKVHKQYEQISGSDIVSDSISQHIREFEAEKRQIEQQIKTLLTSEQTLKKNYKLATSVKGIGLIIAAYMIATTQNFTSFENGRKYACYSGVAPFEHSSGTSIQGKTKVSHLANKKMKALLSNGANSACTWDPEMANYYARKTAQGKEHKQIINAIRCKLINRVFAVVKRQTPYVTLYQQNFA